MILIIKGKSMFYEYFFLTNPYLFLTNPDLTSYKPLLISYKPRFMKLYFKFHLKCIYLYINLLSLNCYYLFTFIIIVFTN